MWLLNSHKKLSNINIRSSWSRFEHCSESLIYPLGSHTCSLFAPFHMDSWPKVKLGSHYVPLLGFIYSYFAPDIPFWSRFRLVYLYFPIFSFIYLYLPTFTPYLPLFGYIRPAVWSVHRKKTDRQTDKQTDRPRWPIYFAKSLSDFRKVKKLLTSFWENCLK